MNHQTCLEYIWGEVDIGLFSKLLLYNEYAAKLQMNHNIILLSDVVWHASVLSKIFSFYSNFHPISSMFTEYVSLHIIRSSAVNINFWAKKPVYVSCVYVSIMPLFMTLWHRCILLRGNVCASFYEVPHVKLCIQPLATVMLYSGEVKSVCLAIEAHTWILKWELKGVSVWLKCSLWLVHLSLKTQICICLTIIQKRLDYNTSAWSYYHNRKQLFCTF